MPEVVEYSKSPTNLSVSEQNPTKISEVTSDKSKPEVVLVKEAEVVQDKTKLNSDLKLSILKPLLLPDRRADSPKLSEPPGKHSEVKI